MVLDPLDVNASEEILWYDNTVFCNICERLVAKEDAVGFPTEDPKEWVCHRCVVGDTS